MPDWAKQQVNAYVAGVNAFIESHHGAKFPPEFTLLNFEPEPWTGPDVVVWVKMMAWDLSGNYSFELLRHDLLRAVGEERMSQLLPPYPVNGLSILGKSGTTEGTEDTGIRNTLSFLPPCPRCPPWLFLSGRARSRRRSNLATRRRVSS